MFILRKTLKIFGQAPKRIIMKNCLTITLIIKFMLGYSHLKLFLGVTQFKFNFEFIHDVTFLTLFLAIFQII